MQLYPERVPFVSDWMQFTVQGLQVFLTYRECGHVRVQHMNSACTKGCLGVSECLIAKCGCLTTSETAYLGIHIGCRVLGIQQRTADCHCLHIPVKPHGIIKAYSRYFRMHFWMPSSLFLEQLLRMNAGAKCVTSQLKSMKESVLFSCYTMTLSTTRSILSTVRMHGSLYAIGPLLQSSSPAHPCTLCRKES